MVFSLVKFVFKKWFIAVILYFILKLCTEFQFPTMPATGQKVVVWWFRPTLVFSLGQAKQ